jgi:DNA-binding YbaB/EbfC family protein
LLVVAVGMLVRLDGGVPTGVTDADTRGPLGGTVTVVVLSGVDDPGVAATDAGDFDGDGAEEAGVLSGGLERLGTVTVGPVVGGTEGAVADAVLGAAGGFGTAVVAVPQAATASAAAHSTAVVDERDRRRARMGSQCQPEGPRPRQHGGNRSTSRLDGVSTVREGSRMQPGMPDLSQIMLKAQQMQDAVEQAKASLAETEVSGSAGGGVVTVMVSGDGELRSVMISPEAVDMDDLETLGDLVVAAVRDAARKVGEMSEQLMTQATGGFDLESLGLGGFPGLPGPPVSPGALPAPGSGD